MPTESIKSGVRGHIKLWKIDEKTGLRTPIAEKSNQIQVSWGYIAAKQLGFRPQPDRDSYAISGMYFEFENQTNPAAAVAVADFPRTLGLEYYATLGDPSNRDYIRVPLRLDPTLSVSATSVGAAVLTENLMSNQLTFFAQTAGTTGVRGLPFSHLNNSKIFAAALVATPRFDDITRDVLFARIVFDVGNQTSKEASAQIGITWDIAFE
jgi:hypothetical protein